jgi:ferric-dicitrate binding protein FerR (iron transport regulator)
VDPDEEAARLLDRVADQVPVPPAPLDRLRDAGRRQRRRQLLTVAAVVLLALLVLLAATGAVAR